MENWRPGVLNKEQLLELIQKNKIRNVDPDTIQDPSSFDLHITDIGYKLKGCVKPQKSYDIPSLIQSYREENLNFDDDGKIILHKGFTYLFQVKEQLELWNNYYGQATGKSTYGRLDILTRLLISNCDSYDKVTNGYSGAMWIEVTPITFSIKIKQGMSLNQLRLFKGDPEVCRIPKKSLNLWGDIILDEHGNRLENTANFDNLTLNLNEDPNLGNSYCAYAVKKPVADQDSEILDLTQNLADGGYLDSEKYWEKLKPTIVNPLSLEIEPERFYILRSRERFKLPESIAIYCAAVTENLGELRIHYAGFAHPCFGMGRDDDKGAPLIFEVRGHNIKAILQHGETLARLEYYYMSENAEIESCTPSYHDQELNLSRYFKTD